MVITHAKILTRLAELRTTAEAATPGPWWIGKPNAITVHAETAPKGMVVAGVGADHLWPSPTDAAYIATWNPAHSLRWIGWAEDVARRHAPDGSITNPLCRTDHGDFASHRWPCPRHFGLTPRFGYRGGRRRWLT